MREFYIVLEDWKSEGTYKFQSIQCANGVITLSMHDIGKDAFGGSEYEASPSLSKSDSEKFFEHYGLDGMSDKEIAEFIIGNGPTTGENFRTLCAAVNLQVKFDSWVSME